MTEPFIGEIKMVAFNYPPKGWAMCNGQTLPISQNQALFSILGTTYGGDGVTNFKLPNLQGRMPVHAGNTITLGEAGGEAAHTLTVNEIPAHNHLPNARSSASNPGTSPAGAVWAAAPAPAFGTGPASPMNAAAVANAGGSQPHENQAPFLVLNFAIALVGIFPSRD